jgi:hypothetical protein
MRMDFTTNQKDILRRLGTALTDAINESAGVSQIYSDAVDAGLDIMDLHLNATVNLRRAAPEKIRVVPSYARVNSLRLTVSLYDPDTQSLSSPDSETSNS